MMITSIVLLILAIPAGLLVAWLARDELKDGKKWFKALVIASVVLALFFWIFGFTYISLTLVFMAIVGLISLVKGSK